MADHVPAVRPHLGDRLRSPAPILRAPPRFNLPALRMAATVEAINAGSMLAGSCPESPSRTARSVACPKPVRASDPYNSACTRSTLSSKPRLASSRTKRQAARMGPIVCELDGPTPILYRSKKLVVTHEIVARWSAGVWSNCLRTPRATRVRPRPLCSCHPIDVFERSSTC